MTLLHLGIGLAGGAAVAGAACRYGALSLSGAVAAALTGGAMYAFGSPVWYGLLLVFFLTSTGWSRWKKAQRRLAERSYEKGSRRDAGQVLANGGLGALLCAASFIWPHDGWLYAFIGVMASVNADTWATEIGGLSRSEPRSIVTLRRVPRGTSGGVSPLGSMAAALGALTIGGAAALLLPLAAGRAAADAAALLCIALVGGLAGAFADSLLGATIQRMNRCPACGATVEQRSHCDRPAERLRGWSWMNNDAVNGISSAIGGLFALGCGFLLGI